MKRVDDQQPATPASEPFFCSDRARFGSGDCDTQCKACADKADTEALLNFVEAVGDLLGVPKQPREGYTTRIMASLLLLTAGVAQSESKASVTRSAVVAFVPHDQLKDGAYYWWKGGDNYPWQPVHVHPTERLKIIGTHFNGWESMFGEFIGPIAAPSSVAQSASELPAELFDSHAVFLEADRAAGPDHTIRSHHVSAVLDAVVRLIRKGRATNNVPSTRTTKGEK